MRKKLENIFYLSIAVGLIVGFFALAGYAWDRSPTTVYQSSIAEGR